MAAFHDSYRTMGALITTSVASSATFSTTAFASQTRYFRIATAGAAGSNVYFSLSDSGVTSATGTQVPLNWAEVFKCNPGEIVYLRGDSTTCMVNIAQLTD